MLSIDPTPPNFMNPLFQDTPPVHARCLLPLLLPSPLWFVIPEGESAVAVAVAPLPLPLPLPLWFVIPEGNLQLQLQLFVLPRQSTTQNPLAFQPVTIYPPPMPPREYHFWVYILASRSKNLYVGMTNSLQRRTLAH